MAAVELTIESLTPFDPICSECEHAAFGTGGLLCTQVMLYVEDHEAVDCEMYEPTPWARSQGVERKGEEDE